MSKFRIGDVVARFNLPNELYEVIKFDGIFIVCKNIKHRDNIKYSGVYFFESEIYLNKSETRNNIINNLLS